MKESGGCGDGVWGAFFPLVLFDETITAQPTQKTPHRMISILKGVLSCGMPVLQSGDHKGLLDNLMSLKMT